MDKIDFTDKMKLIEGISLVTVEYVQGSLEEKEKQVDINKLLKNLLLSVNLLSTRMFMKADPS